MLEFIRIINNDFASVLSLLSSIIMVIVTIIYVGHTRRQANYAKESVELVAKQFKTEKQPCIVPTLVDSYGHAFDATNYTRIQLGFDINLKNSGDAPAINVYAIAERLYKEWFVDLRFPGYEKVQTVDGVPEGWRVVGLSEIAPIVTGKRDANFGTPDGAYPFFTCAQDPIKAPSYSFNCDAVILAGNGDFNVKLYRGQFEAYQRTYVFSPRDASLIYLLFNSIRLSAKLNSALQQ